MADLSDLQGTASSLAFISPQWPAPANVVAWASTRQGGISTGPYASLNLGTNSGDGADLVAANRNRVACQLGAQPLWLQQVHGTEVVYGPALQTDFQQAVTAPQADASWTDHPGQILAVLTADCLPVLLCHSAGHWVAVAHAGWRGLAAGVLGKLLNQLPAAGAHAMAWLGPAISAASYEVGAEVYHRFISLDPAYADAFTRHPQNGEDWGEDRGEERWQADLYAIARRQLKQLGVTAVYGGEYCTLRQRDLFFSYRRDQRCGRQACFIGLSS